MKVFLAKITNRENVDKVINGKSFIHEDIYNFESDIKKDMPIFLVFSGDKSKIDWLQGLIGVGIIEKPPFDKGYNKKKERYFKIEIKPILVLDKPLEPKFTKLHPKYQKELYDVPYVGANHFPNQAIAQTDGKGTIALFNLLKEFDTSNELGIFNNILLKDLSDDNIKNEFKKYLLNKNEPSTVGSYLNALEGIPKYLESAGVSCDFKWSRQVNIDSIKKTADFVKEESNKENGGILNKYTPKSHYNNGWFISGINNFISFLKEIPDPIFEKNIFTIDEFIYSLVSAGLIFNKQIIKRFVASLAAKRFVILTGLSGSGKTKIAESFALWISNSINQICFVSVGADWTNREPLLGFPNALQPGTYVKPENGVLDLIISAEKYPSNPYFLILDEMNLSHVERYFADFLSAMESSTGYLSLHSDTDDWKDTAIPACIQLPKNLFIIGTVNIDETTYMFSPKVLDRANVIEFRVLENEMDNFLENSKEINIDILSGAGASMGQNFVDVAKEYAQDDGNLKDELMPFFRKLQEAGAEFGYRTATEISSFVKKCNNLFAGEMERDEIVDAAIMQKLLPKLHGSRNKIERILKDLGNLCLKNGTIKDFPESSLDNIKYPISFEKLQRMHKRVISDGFTSYAEA